MSADGGVDGGAPARENAPPTSTPHVFLALDGLRGIAALLVLGLHLGQLGLLTPAFTPASGYLAVDIFFVLSGFVIAYAYDGRFAERMSIRRFLLARVIRFYPLFFLMLLVGAIRIALGTRGAAEAISPAGWAGMIPQLFFIPAIGQFDTKFPWNPPAWSLCAELFINIVYAFCWRWLTFKRLLVLVVAAAVFLVFVSLGEGSLAEGPRRGQAVSFFARVFFGFFCGVLLFHLYRRGLRAIQAPAWVPFGIIVIALILTPPEPLRPIYDAGVVLLIGPLLVWLGASAMLNRGEATFSRLSGNASYALYIIHYPIILWILPVDRIVLGDFLQEVRPLSGLVVMIALVCAALLADGLFDAPARRWLKRKLQPSPSLRPALDS